MFSTIVFQDHKEGTDCQNTLECRTSSSNKPRRKNLRCRDDGDCAGREVCHSFFKVCFSKPTQRSKLRVTGQTKTAPSCKTDRDCRQNQSCHVFFGTCLDKAYVPVATTTTSRPSVPTCKTNAECPKGQYCHDFFKFCLPNLTTFFEPTSSTPRTGCTSDSDCENDGDFCHNLTRLCLPMPTNATPTPPRKTSFSCNSHADCKMTEFCHFLIGMRNQDQSRGAQPLKHLKSALGVCIARALKDVPKDPSPVSLNCSQTADCGKGRCCLRDLALCVGYRLPGQLCVAEVSSFLIVVIVFQLLILISKEGFLAKSYISFVFMPYFLADEAQKIVSLCIYHCCFGSHTLISTLFYRLFLSSHYKLLYFGAIFNITNGRFCMATVASIFSALRWSDIT